MSFSIVMPMDVKRLPLFANTKRVYDKQIEELGVPAEFIIPSRSADEVSTYLKENGLDKYVRVISYTHEIGFNPSKALNIGLREAQHDNIIVTSPEVMPKTDVLKQLLPLCGSNVVCQVFDEGSPGVISMSLVNKNFRSADPSMYFLALFNKKDLLAINGWDEDFMLGYAWEDTDFGARWSRAQLPFIMRDDIQAVHQWHERPETIPNGYNINREKLNWNNIHKVIRPRNGFVKEGERVE